MRIYQNLRLLDMRVEQPEKCMKIGSKLVLDATCVSYCLLHVNGQTMHTGKKQSIPTELVFEIERIEEKRNTSVWNHLPLNSEKIQDILNQEKKISLYNNCGVSCISPPCNLEEALLCIRRKHQGCMLYVFTIVCVKKRNSVSFISLGIGKFAFI